MCLYVSTVLFAASIFPHNFQLELILCYHSAKNCPSNQSHYCIHQIFHTMSVQSSTNSHKFKVLQMCVVQHIYNVVNYTQVLANVHYTNITHLSTFGVSMDVFVHCTCTQVLRSDLSTFIVGQVTINIPLVAIDTQLSTCSSYECSLQPY